MSTFLDDNMNTESKNDGITSNTRIYLGETRPWVRFLAILGFISSGLMVLAAFFMTIVPSNAVFQQSEYAQMKLLAIVLYLIFGGVGFLLSNLLYQYSKSIGDYLSSDSPYDLEEAIEKQKTFWKINGTIAAIILVLYLLLIIFGIIANIFA